VIQLVIFIGTLIQINVHIFYQCESKCLKIKGCELLLKWRFGFREPRFSIPYRIETNNLNLS
jgi:hypothetical protein